MNKKLSTETTVLKEGDEIMQTIKDVILLLCTTMQMILSNPITAFFGIATIIALIKIAAWLLKGVKQLFVHI